MLYISAWRRQSVQGPPLFVGVLVFAPGSCRWNPGWIEVTCGSFTGLMLGGAFDTANFRSFSSLSSWWFLEIMIWVQWPGWGILLFFLDGDQRSDSHVHMYILGKIQLCWEASQSTMFANVVMESLNDSGRTLFNASILLFVLQSLQSLSALVLMLTVVVCSRPLLIGNRRGSSRIASCCKRCWTLTQNPLRCMAFLGGFGVLAFPDVRESLLGM